MPRRARRAEARSHAEEAIRVRCEEGRLGHLRLPSEIRSLSPLTPKKKILGSDDLAELPQVETTKITVFFLTRIVTHAPLYALSPLGTPPSDDDPSTCAFLAPLVTRRKPVGAAARRGRAPSVAFRSGSISLAMSQAQAEFLISNARPSRTARGVPPPRLPYRRASIRDGPA